MSEYNGLMNTHFSSCPKLGQFEDPYRDRTVSIFFLDREDMVGVSDGVDSWLCAPASLQSVNGVKLVQDAMHGKYHQQAPRQRKLLFVDAAPRTRRQLHV